MKYATISMYCIDMCLNSTITYCKMFISDALIFRMSCIHWIMEVLKHTRDMWVLSNHTGRETVHYFFNLVRVPGVCFVYPAALG